MRIVNVLHRAHVRILEFLWMLVLPRPRKRRPRWKRYIDYCLGNEVPDPYESGALVYTTRRNW